MDFGYGDGIPGFIAGVRRALQKIKAWPEGIDGLANPGRIINGFHDHGNAQRRRFIIQPGGYRITSKIGYAEKSLA